MSEVGSQVTLLAFPTLAIVQFHAGVAAVSVLVAAERVPFPVLSLVAGGLIDRMRKRPLMVACNLARLVLLAAIPALSFAGALRLWELFAASAGVGVFTVFFDIAYLAYVPSLVGRDRLLQANSRLQVSDSAAQLAGPGLGGLLIQAVSATRAVLVDATSFLVSAICLLAIRRSEVAPASGSKRSLVRETREGLRHVFGNTVLRSQLLCMGAGGIFASAFQGPLYIFAYVQLHLSPGLLGAMLASQGIGALLGTFGASPIVGRLGVGPTIALLDGTAIGLSGLIALGTVIPPVLLFFPCFVLIGFTGAVGNIAQVTLRQSLSPEHLQARMNAVFRTVFWGAWPLGNVLGGVVAARIGAGTTIWVMAVLGALANTSIVFTPLWRVRT
ncbi:MAG: MFS transporter, partial [Candidatus Dormibacteria bacterium]